LLIGVVLLAGALTRAAAIAGGVLVLGATSVEHVNLIGDQLVHALFLAIVIAFGSDNRYSVDRLLVGHRSMGA
jgi:thiosulfate dehydrogenase [quinone] large subunit